MSRKILALDLDGTLTDSNKEITPRTKEMIAKMQEQGHIVVLASGRPTPGVQRVADKLHLSEMGGYMLSYNGARVQDCKTGEILFQQTMPLDMIPILFDEAKEHQIGMMTYQNGKIISGRSLTNTWDWSPGSMDWKYVLSRIRQRRSQRRSISVWGRQIRTCSTVRSPFPRKVWRPY